MRLAADTRRRRRRLRRRTRRGGSCGRLLPPRRLACRQRPVAVVHAPPAGDTERAQRVARGRNCVLGSRARVRPPLDELLALRGAVRRRRAAVAGATSRASRAPAAEGTVPARQPARLQPEVLPVLGAPVRRLPARGGSPPRRHRRPDGRGVSSARRSPVSPTLALSLLLATASAVALNWGYYAQHGRASRLPPLVLRQPLRSLFSLFADVRWLLGFLVGIGGWVLYVAALRLGPLSIVQAASAGGIGILALLVSRGSGGRLSRLESGGVAAAVGGLVLLSLSLAGQEGRHLAPGRGSVAAVAGWIAATGLAAGLLQGPLGRRLRGGAGLGIASGLCYAAGDVGTKAAVAGGGRLAFVPVVLAAHGLGFVALQLGFQRGGALATAGVATLFTTAVP